MVDYFSVVPETIIIFLFCLCMHDIEYSNTVDWGTEYYKSSYI